MNRESLIAAVKVKIDEVSPFDNVHGNNTTQDFIAADSDTDYDEVNPVENYIKDCLDKAAEYCLNILPLSLLSEDVDYDTYTAHINKKGVGIIDGIDKYVRFVRLVELDGVWERDVRVFITTSDPMYALQQKLFTRGGVSKPVVAYNPEQQTLELYSFPKELCPVDGFDHAHAHTELYYIKCNIAAEKVKSNISDYIVLKCAAMVEDILGESQTAQILMNEFTNKLAPILK